MVEIHSRFASERICKYSHFVTQARRVLASRRGVSRATRKIILAVDTSDDVNLKPGLVVGGPRNSFGGLDPNPTLPSDFLIQSVLELLLVLALELCVSGLGYMRTFRITTKSCNSASSKATPLQWLLNPRALPNGKQQESTLWTSYSKVGTSTRKLRVGSEMRKANFDELHG
jgi:hypothetical protein